MFRVKICGITSVDDARRAADAGADAIGLNFFAQSPRYVNRDTARQIADAVAGHTQVVGVFVNSSLDQMVDLADRLPLDIIQLHGDEPTDRVLALSPRRVMRAFRLREGGEQQLAEYVTHCEQLGVPLSAILVDAYQSGKYGGTGNLVDLSQMPKICNIAGEVKVILAGGLDPKNVRRAILTAHCDGVDVASGVEISPGKKDYQKMRIFVRAAREAFEQIEST